MMEDMMSSLVCTEEMCLHFMWAGAGDTRARGERAYVSYLHLFLLAAYKVIPLVSYRTLF